jgi:hypothetical protein
MLGQKKSSKKSGLQRSELKVSCDSPISSVIISLSLRSSLSPNPGHAKESKKSLHTTSLPLVAFNLF